MKSPSFQHQSQVFCFRVVERLYGVETDVSADLLLQGHGAMQPARADCILFLLLVDEIGRCIRMVVYACRDFEGAI